MIREIKKLINEWRMIKETIENYEALDDCVNNLDTRVFELESMISRLNHLKEVDYEEACEFEDVESINKPKQLTIYQFIDELPF